MNLAKVLELWHRVYWVSICPEIPFSDLPYLLCCHPVPLPLCPLCELCGVGVAAISDFPRQHNVTAGTLCVVKVDLLHNEHSILNVLVQEVYVDTHPRLRPPLTPLD